MDDKAIADQWNQTDPNLLSSEKETMIRWSKPDDRAIVHTDETGIGRRLCKHDESTVKSVNIIRNGSKMTIGPAGVESDDEVVGARIEIPIATLKVQKNSRSFGGHASVVTNSVLEDDDG